MKWWEAQVGRPQKEGKEEEEEQFQLEEVVSVGCLSITLSVTQRPFPLQFPRLQLQLLSACCKSQGNPVTPRNQLARAGAGVSSGRAGRVTETWLEVTGVGETVWCVMFSNGV